MQSTGVIDKDLSEMKQITGRYKPTPLIVDTKHLAEGDKRALVKLIQAANIMN